MIPAARVAALGVAGVVLVALGPWEPAAGAASPAISQPVVGAREGMLAPGVVLADLEGGSLDLAALRGKVVVLNFWATWCGPCTAEMPDLDRLWEAVRGDGILLYAVNLDVADAAGLKRFVGERGIRVPILLDPRRLALRAFEIGPIPTTVIIDKRGVVRYRILGARPWTHPDYAAGLRVLKAEDGAG